VPDKAPDAGALEEVDAGALAADVAAADVAAAGAAAADFDGGGVVADGDVLHAAMSTAAGATRIAYLVLDITFSPPRIQVRASHRFQTVRGGWRRLPSAEP
jgi:hypothetical protein